MKASELIQLFDEGRGAEASPASAPTPVLSADEFINAVDEEKRVADLRATADSGGILDGLQDKAASAIAGFPSVGKAVYDIGRLVTGDNDFTKRGSQFWESMADDVRNQLMSKSGLAKRQLMNHVLDSDDTDAVDVLKFVLENPGAAVDMGIESLPTMGASAIGGGGTAMLANAGAKMLGKQLTKQALAKAATAGTVGTNALMNAADTFTADDVENLPLADRYKGAGVSGAISLALGKLLDGGAEGMVARKMAGSPSKGGVVGGVVKGAATEAPQEFGEESGNAVGEQVATGERNVNKVLKRGTLGGTVGGLMGGAVGSVSAGSASGPKAQAQKDAPVEYAPTSKTLDALGAEIESGPVEERLERPEPKIAEASNSIVGEGKRIGEAQELPDGRVVRVQNRDRSSGASVAQMTKIASNLDYGRMSPGRDFANGAPVVAYGNVDEAHKGKTDYAVTVDGERIPVRYAVVEAGDVLASNDVSGNVVKEYKTAGADRMRAIAGNGRVASTQRAYELGKAENYRSELIADAASHGVDPAVIEQMKSPVLVRIMPEDKIRTDVGSISNTSSNLDMSVVEKANDDAANIDFERLEFDENGNPTDETVRQFVGSFPPGQAAGMMSSDGTVSKSGEARFGAALFKKAYDNDQLTALYAETTDGEAKGVLKAMAAVAGKMVRLEGGGDLDLRPIIAEAAQIIVNARREGKTVAQYVAEGSLGQSAEAAIVAEALDANKRSVKEMTRILGEAADTAFDAMSPQESLIGEKPTRDDVFNKVKEEIDAKREAGKQQSEESAGSTEEKPMEDGGRSSAVEEDVQRDAPESRGQDDVEADGRQEVDGSEREEEVKLSRRSVSVAKEKIQSLLDRIRNGETKSGRGRDSFEDYFPVDVSFVEKARLAGVDIDEGYVHSIDDSSVTHTKSHHGSDKEYQRGQIPWTDEDFLKIPDVVSDPDKVEFGGRTRYNQQPALKVYKKLDDGTVVVLEEVRKGRKKLMLQTAYIQKPSAPRAKHQEIDVASRTRPKRSEAIPDETIVGHNDPDVKGSRRGNTDEAKRQKAKAEIDKALASSADVGEAYRTLRDDGRVHVVEETRDIPADVRKRGQIVDGDGGIQGLYDPKTGKVYLVANNLTTNTAKGVFLHEVGVHMAADAKEEVKALALRARNMINNGARNGDATALAVKRRMVDAGLIADVKEDIKPGDAEEAFAYLVEVAANADSRSPFRKWWDSVTAKIKNWLGKIGVKMELKPEEYVELARGNADGLAHVRGRKLKLGEGVRRSVLGQSVKKHLGGEWGRAIQLDETGRRKFAWGEHALVGTTNVALDVLEAAIPAMRTAYSIRYAKPEVRRQIRDYAARCDKAVQEAGGVAEEMMKWSSEDRKLLSDAVEKMLAPGVNPPQHVVEAAAKMSDLMTKQTQELVELGMLSEESAARWRGRYLPRFYEKRGLLPGEDFFKNMFRRNGAGRGIGGGSLKGRGCFKVVDAAAVPDFVKLGWEVRDARYEFKEKQGVVVDLEHKKHLETGQPVTIWRDWTPEERAQMGEIRDAGYRFAMGWMQMQQDIALGRLFKGIAENSEYCSNYEQEGYSKVPDTEIADTGGVKRYGVLAGKYVRDDVLAAIMPHAEVQTGFMRGYKKLMAYWKEGKTALNPVSHMNNVVGNIVMAHLAGVNMWDAVSYAKTLTAIKNNEDWIKEAQEAGLYSGLFTREEIAEMLPEEFSKMLDSEKSAVARGADWVFTYMMNYGLRKGMRWAYEFEDKVFRLLIYKSAADRGLSPKDAVDYTLKFIPTYDDLPGGARKIRDTAIPFFAWTYKTLPMICVMAARYPWRFAAIATVLHTANALSYAMGAGDDDDDWFTRFKKGQKLAEAEGKLLPEYMRGYGAFANPKFLRLGTDETTGLPIYWNISNFIPGGGMFDVDNQMGGMPFPEVLNISSPAYSLYCALFLNKDTFMGQPITLASDTGKEAAEKRAAYVWRQIAPALAAGGYHFERVANAMANATGNEALGYTGIGRNGQAVTPVNAFFNTVGIKVRDVDFEQEHQRRGAAIKREEKELMSNIRHMASLLNKGAVTEKAAREYVESQKEKLKRLGEKARDLTAAAESREANVRK